MRYFQKLTSESDEDHFPSDDDIVEGSEEDDCSTNSSDTEPEHEEPSNVVSNVGSDESEADDSAPEEVSFNAGAEISKLIRKRCWGELQLQRKEVRNKRARIHSRNVEQKEHKNKDRALPSDVLECLESSVTEPRSPAVVVPKELADSDSEKKVDVSAEKVVGIHGSTMFKVKNVNKITEDIVPEDVKNFRKNALYGSKNRRENSTQEYFAKLEKKSRLK